MSENIYGTTIPRSWVSRSAEIIESGDYNMAPSDRETFNRLRSGEPVSPSLSVLAKKEEQLKAEKIKADLEGANPSLQSGPAPVVAPVAKPRPKTAPIDPYHISSLNNNIRRALQECIVGDTKFTQSKFTSIQLPGFTSSRQPSLDIICNVPWTAMRQKKFLASLVARWDGLILDTFECTLPLLEGEMGIDIIITGGRSTDFRNGVLVRLVFASATSAIDGIFRGYHGYGELVMNHITSSGFNVDRAGINYLVKADNVELANITIANDSYTMDNFIGANGYNRFSYGMPSKESLMEALVTSPLFTLQSIGMDGLDDNLRDITTGSPILKEFRSFVVSYYKTRASSTLPSAVPGPIQEKAVKSIIKDLGFSDSITSLYNQHYSEKVIVERLEGAREILGLSKEVFADLIDAFEAKLLSTSARRRKDFSFEVLSSNITTLARKLTAA